MRYSSEIEAMILAQIVRTPDKEIILPDWCYWEGDPQPWVYIDRMPTRLMRHLYQLVVGELHPNHGLVNPPGVDPRNINPRLASSRRRGEPSFSVHEVTCTPATTTSKVSDTGARLAAQRSSSARSQHRET